MKRTCFEMVLLVTAVLPIDAVYRCIILEAVGLSWSLYKALEVYKVNIIKQERKRAEAEAEANYKVLKMPTIRRAK